MKILQSSDTLKSPSAQWRDYETDLKFEAHRFNESLLAALERQLLIAIAARLPRWVSPDIMTALGLLGGAITGLAFIAANLSENFLYIAALGLIINWFGDSLDGSLARVRRIERPIYGFYVDVSSDIAAQFMVMIGFGLSPLMHFSTALMALLGSVLLRFYDLLQLLFSGLHQTSHLGIGASEVRIMIIGLFLLEALFGPLSINTAIGSLTLFDIVGVMTLLVGVSSVVAAFFVDRSRFARIDPVRAGSNQSDARPFSMFKLRNAEPSPLGADGVVRHDPRLQDR